MKRKIIFTVIAVMLMALSCEIQFYDRLQLEENPFSDPLDIERVTVGDSLRFLVLSDAHLNRELRDSGVHRNDENMLSFLSKHKDEIDAVLLLGDMMDEGSEEDAEVFRALLDRIKAVKDFPLISIAGNHDYNSIDKEDYEKILEGYDKCPSTIGAYRISDTAIYKIDSAKRILGRDQLKYLEEAIEKSDAKYSIVLSHVPMSLSGAIQSHFQFVLSDVNERNELISILHDKRALYFAAHHHIGDVLNSYSESFKEYVFPAYHKKDLLWGLESEGYYHIAELNEKTGRLRILSFQIDNTDPDISAPDKQRSLSI